MSLAEVARARLSRNLRLGILIATAVVALDAASFVDPVAQPASYHEFAATGPVGGIAHFGNVVSNIGFLVFGALGLWFVSGARGRARFGASREGWAYAVFFAGAALTAVGSGYYHFAPDNWGLLWDRLPMTVAFMALFAAFIADRIDGPVGIGVMLPLLVAVGVGSAVYWYVSETLGHGDLRIYGLVQFYPALAIPLICVFFAGRRTDGKSVAWLIFWYALAKLCEYFDVAIHVLSDGALSGHTIKHLVAAMAVLVVIQMLRNTAKRAGEGR